MAAGVDGALEGSGAGSQPESVLSWQDAGALGWRVSLGCIGPGFCKSCGGQHSVCGGGDPAPWACDQLLPTLTGTSALPWAMGYRAVAGVGVSR